MRALRREGLAPRRGCASAAKPTSPHDPPGPRTRRTWSVTAGRTAARPQGRAAQTSGQRGIRKNLPCHSRETTHVATTEPVGRGLQQRR